MKTSSEAIVPPLLLAFATALFVAVWSHDRPVVATAACPRLTAVIESHPARAIAREAAGSVAVATGTPEPARRSSELAQAAGEASLAFVLTTPTTDGDPTLEQRHLRRKNVLRLAQSFFNRLW